MKVEKLILVVLLQNADMLQTLPITYLDIHLGKDTILTEKKRVGGGGESYT